MSSSNRVDHKTRYNSLDEENKTIVPVTDQSPIFFWNEKIWGNIYLFIKFYNTIILRLVKLGSRVRDNFTCSDGNLLVRKVCLTMY